MTSNTKVKRSRVYLAIDSERDYQDVRFSPEIMEANDRTLEVRIGSATDRTLDEFILYIQQYAAEAGALTTHGNEVEALNFVRKVGALCVGCMERHGAPQRVGFERNQTTPQPAPKDFDETEPQGSYPEPRGQ